MEKQRPIFKTGSYYNMTDAAILLGLPRSTLYYYIKTGKIKAVRKKYHKLKREGDYFVRVRSYWKRAISGKEMVRYWSKNIVYPDYTQKHEYKPREY